MTHYAHIQTPYGNFAASTYLPGEQRDGVTLIHLEPVGALDALPTHQSYIGRLTLDHDALKAEGARQARERGADLPDWFTPSPSFTINGKTYAGTVEVKLETLSEHYGERAGERVAYASSWTNEPLTPSAASAIAALILEREAEILTPEFRAMDEADRLVGELHWARKDEEKARITLSEAEAKVTSLVDRLEAASAKLDELGL